MSQQTHGAVGWTADGADKDSRDKDNESCKELKKKIKQKTYVQSRVDTAIYSNIQSEWMFMTPIYLTYK